ncbi:MAG: M48 family metallopeptidase [Gemmobacter sp.]
MAVLGDPPIAIELRRSAGARRITLRVSGRDGRVTLTLPPRVAETDALAFAASREGWLRAALGRVPAPCPVGPGTMLPVEGTPHRIALAPGRFAPHLADGCLILPGAEATAAARAAAFLRNLARARLAAACDRHAGSLGRGYAGLALRDTRARWGSCAADGMLRFSWRLAMAPPEVLDYVAAHEVAHLVRMDHSPRFWAVVRDLCPDHARHRAWLRAEGAGLHRFRFGD